MYSCTVRAFPLRPHARSAKDLKPPLIYFTCEDRTRRLLIGLKRSNISTKAVFILRGRTPTQRATAKCSLICYLYTRSAPTLSSIAVLAIPIVIFCYYLSNPEGGSWRLQGPKCF